MTIYIPNLGICYVYHPWLITPPDQPRMSSCNKSLSIATTFRSMCPMFQAQLRTSKLIPSWGLVAVGSFEAVDHILAW